MESSIQQFEEELRRQLNCALLEAEELRRERDEAIFKLQQLTQGKDQEVLENENVWEVFNVVLNQESNQHNFGLKLTGGRGEEYSGVVRNEEVRVAEIIKSSAADGKLISGDEVLSVNDIMLQNMPLTTVVSILKDAGSSVCLTVRRKVQIPAKKLNHQLKVNLVRKNKKTDFGLKLGMRLFVESVQPNSLASLEGNIKQGDAIVKFQNVDAKSLSLAEAMKLLSKCKDRLELVVVKPVKAVIKEVSAVAMADRVSRIISPALSPATMLEPRLIGFKREGWVGVRVVGGNRTGIFISHISTHSEAHRMGLLQADMILKVNNTELGERTREEAAEILLSAADYVALLVQYRRADYDRLMQESSGSGAGDLFYVRVNMDYNVGDGSNNEQLCFNRGEVFQVVDTLHNGAVGTWSVVRVTKGCSIIKDSKSSKDKKDGKETKDSKTKKNSSNTSIEAIRKKKKRGTILSLKKVEPLYAIYLNALSASSTSGNKEAASKKTTSLFKKRPKSSFIPNLMSEDSLNIFQNAIEDKNFELNSIPAYDRVVYKNVSYKRPIILYGMLHDVLANLLLTRFQEAFEKPILTSNGGNSEVPYFTGASIKSVTKKNKHALINVGPSSINKLLRTDIIPIVIMLDADTKQEVKKAWSLLENDLGNYQENIYNNSISHIYGKGSTKESIASSLKGIKKALQKWQDLSKRYSYLFHGICNLSVGESLVEELLMMILNIQKDRVWVNETRTKLYDDDKFYAINDVNLSFLPLFNISTSTTPIFSRPSSLPRFSSDPNLLYDKDKNSVDSKNDDCTSKVRYLPSYSTVSNLTLKATSQNENAKQTSPSNSVIYKHNIDYNNNKLEKGNQSEKKYSNGNLFDNCTEFKNANFNGETEASYKKVANENCGIQYGNSPHRVENDNCPDQNENNYNNINQMTMTNNIPSYVKNYNNFHEGVASQQPYESYPADENKNKQYSKDFHSTDSADVSGCLRQIKSPLIMLPRHQPQTTHHQHKFYQVPGEQKLRNNQFTKSHNKPHYYSQPPPKLPKPIQPPLHSLHMSHHNPINHPRSYPNYQPFVSYQTQNNQSRNINQNNQSTNQKLTPELSMRPKAKAPETFRKSMHESTSQTISLNKLIFDNFKADSLLPINRNENNIEIKQEKNVPRFETKRNFKTQVPHAYNTEAENNVSTMLEARGVFGSEGGVLELKETGVKLVIPKGCIEEGVNQELYFRVCNEQNRMPPLDSDKGEMPLSPLVMCGPTGVVFKKPIEMHLPPSSNFEPSQWSLNLKSLETPSGNLKSWQNVKIENGNDYFADTQNSIKIMIDHF